MTPNERRVVAVVTCQLTAAAALTRLARPVGGLQVLERSPEQTLPFVLAMGFLLVTAWATGTVLLTLAARRGDRAGRWAAATLRRTTPAVLRRAVEVALGASTVLAVTGGVAQAATPPAATSHVAASAAATVSQVVQPSSVRQTAAVRSAVAEAASMLDRPVTTPPDSVPTADVPDLDRPAADPSRGIGLVTSVPRPPTQHAASVRVRAGDTLWSVAARAMPSGTSDAEIEQSWHRWYAENRAVIGADPNLLLPGQVLTPPPP